LCGDSSSRRRRCSTRLRERPHATHAKSRHVVSCCIRDDDDDDGGGAATAVA
jgi:hypothetical protein